MRSRGLAWFAALLVAAAAACSSFAEVGDTNADASPDGGGADGDLVDATPADREEAADAPSSDADAGGRCPVGVGPSMTVVQLFTGRPLCVDRTEVTSAQYAAFRSQTFDPSLFPRIPPECVAAGTDPADDGGDGPRVQVSLCSAARFCVAQGKRLCGSLEDGGAVFVNDANAPDPPMEWDVACANGAEGSYYPWGSTDPAGAIAAKCQTASYDPDATAPRTAGAEPACGPGGDGPLDMIGNVWEWQNGRRDNAGGASYTSIRGGGYESTTVGSGCKHGHGVDAVYGAYAAGRPTVGFRCCAEPRF